ncbi:uncharacterized protein LOC114137830 [Xiphophorus couchianus]|uniref:uncharacterized protein LOC114137830 n=1 Tax=Xiphophorus couchianus TaxID=32473 RepID=UPI001015E5AE|nr:uncharacterized protein LOC114137830 [Xiphophorus couchianus]
MDWRLVQAETFVLPSDIWSTSPKKQPCKDKQLQTKMNGQMDCVLVAVKIEYDCPLLSWKPLVGNQRPPRSKSGVTGSGPLKEDRTGDDDGDGPAAGHPVGGCGGGGHLAGPLVETTGKLELLQKTLPKAQDADPMAQGDGGLDVFVYGQADKLRNFVAGIFIPQYHYPFPVALCFTQVLVSLVFINLLHALGLVHLRPYSRSLGERLLLPAICNSVHSVLMTWAKASSPYANLFLFTVPLLPLLTLGFSFALKVASLPSHHLSVLISILSGMFVVITASNGIPVVESLEYLYAPLALILHSLSLITFTKVSESVRQQPSDVQPSVFDIYYAQLVIQGGVLGFLWLLHPDKPWLVLKMSSWRNLLFHGYLLAIVLLGMVLNFLVCTSTLCVSPLAAALLYSARYMVQPFFHLL